MAAINRNSKGPSLKYTYPAGEFEKYPEICRYYF